MPYDTKKMTDAMKGALKEGKTMMTVKKPKMEDTVEPMPMEPHMSSMSTKQMSALGEKKLGDECAFEMGVKVSGIREQDDEKVYDFDVKYVKMMNPEEYKETKEGKPKDMRESYEKTKKNEKKQYVTTQESHYVG